MTKAAIMNGNDDRARVRSSGAAIRAVIAMIRPAAAAAMPANRPRSESRLPNRP
jgi:hypothetical protein